MKRNVNSEKILRDFCFVFGVSFWRKAANKQTAVKAMPPAVLVLAGG